MEAGEVMKRGDWLCICILTFAAGYALKGREQPTHNDSIAINDKHLAADEEFLNTLEAAIKKSYGVDVIDAAFAASRQVYS